MKRDFSSAFGLWLRLVRTGRFAGRPSKRPAPNVVRYEWNTNLANPYMSEDHTRTFNLVGAFGGSAFKEKA